MKEGLKGLAAGRLFGRQRLFFWLAATGLLLITLVHLGSQPSGLSPAELASVRHSSKLHSIVTNPINAPHDILALGLSKISTGLFALRLSSAIWAIIFAVSFFSLAKSMFGKTIGLIGAAVLATTPLFLVAGRQASAEIMLAAPALVMVAYVWLSRIQTAKFKALLLLSVSVALMLYIPGMVWWLAGGAIAGRKKIKEAVFSVTQAEVYTCLALGLIIITPLVLALADNWRLIKPLALVPAHFSTALSELKSIGWMAAAWVYKTPFHYPLIIDRLHLLSLVQVVLLVFGLFALFKAAGGKAWALVVAIAFSIVAAGLNDNLGLLLLGLPAAGVLIAVGLRYLYVEWRGIFPRNPAAKYLAILLISVLGAVQFMYGIRYALIAWPHTPATRQTYVIR